MSAPTSSTQKDQTDPQAAEGTKPEGTQAEDKQEDKPKGYTNCEDCGFPFSKAQRSRKCQAPKACARRQAERQEGIALEKLSGVHPTRKHLVTPELETPLAKALREQAEKEAAEAAKAKPAAPKASAPKPQAPKGQPAGKTAAKVA